MNSRFGISVVLAVLVIATQIAVAASPDRQRLEIPAASLDKLQDILAIVRDRLWEVDDIFWHRGEYARCVAALRLIAAIDPRDTEAYSNAAWLMENALMESADKAERTLLEGLERNRSVYDLYWELGFFYYIHARFELAVDCLEKAVAFDVPDYVWHFLAHAYEHAGDVGTALSIWFQQEAAEQDNPVPGIQIERIISGRPPAVPPEMLRHIREEKSQESETSSNTDT